MPGSRIRGRHGCYGLTRPEKYRKRLRRTNMQEQLNEEIRGRERVIRIFPNDASALCLIGALLAEQNKACQGRKYLDIDKFKEWATARAAAGDGNNVVAIAGGKPFVIDRTDEYL